MSMEATPGALTSQGYIAHFGMDPADVIQAPGRVNLIGEHTDYNDGYVLPIAINFHTAIAYGPSTERNIEVIALNEGNARAVIPLDEPQVFDETNLWTNYVRGVISELKKAGFKLKGGQLVISGNVPLGAGLSSSAALEMALIKTLTNLSGESIDGELAAKLGQAAENNFVGCNCGIMDQLISALGDQDKALLIDCRSLETTPVSIPSELELLVVNSNVKRQLVDGEYNTRREECEAVAWHFHVPALRDVSLTELESASADLTDAQFRRARHVITENARTEQMLQALSAADIPAISQLMADSHLSMRDDFEITVPEIDALVEMISGVMGESGGVRMTGGGFGGCVVVLAPHELSNQIEATVSDKYPSVAGHAATIYRCTAASGAFTELAP